MSRESRRRKNLHQVERYILMGESLHPYSRGEAQVRAEGKRQKGRSLAPWSGKAEEMLNHEDYVHARKRIEVALNYLRHYRRRFWFILQHASQNPAEVTHFKEGWTPHARSWKRAYKAALRELESEVERRDPGVVLHVPMSPGEQPEEEKITVQDTYRELRNLVHKWMECDYSKTAAVHEVAEKEDCAPSKVWRALAETEKSSA